MTTTDLHALEDRARAVYDAHDDEHPAHDAALDALTALREADASARGIAKLERDLANQRVYLADRVREAARLVGAAEALAGTGAS